jgi:hypothetical protein
MIVAGSASPLLLASAAGGYNLTNSLRFRASASAYLNRTPASNGNSNTWTWSAWVKRGSIGNLDQVLLSAGPNGSNYEYLRFESTNELFYALVSGGSLITTLKTTAVYRDPSAWYHIVFVRNGATRTIYVNNVNIISGGASSAVGKINQTEAHSIGRRQDTADQYFDGYLTETIMVDGQALDPSSFGEYSATTGVWQPIEYVGTYGTNGYYLPFTDNSALTTSSNVGLGKDFSGNGNYWTTNNISITAGSTYDSMTDVPTLTSATASNFAVLNPLQLSAEGALTEGNLTHKGTSSANTSACLATIPCKTGLWYSEFTVTGVNSTYPRIGVVDLAVVLANSSLGFYGFPGLASGVAYLPDGNKSTAGGASAYGATFTTGDVIGLAIDATNGAIYFSKNGTWQNSGVPTSGSSKTGAAYTYTGGSLDLNISTGVYNTSSGFNANFGQRPFSYTPPTGFVALNTFNLPTPTIGATATTQANKYFDINLYNGNSSTQAITNSGFQPSFVWVKGRNSATQNRLFNILSGVQKELYSNLTNAEATDVNGIQAFNSNGFTLGSNDANTSGTTYVGWQWNGGGTGVTNTAGSITSTVSANTSAGFSVVTYTGTGANATIGHGLGVAPKMVIVKVRSTTNNWTVYHANANASPANGCMFLDLTSSFGTGATLWNNTMPTSTVFNVGSASETNSSGATYVAYCFSEVAGYSKFGSFTGNFSSDGPFVYTGFRPAYVMFKNASSSENWFVMDATRSPSNIVNLELYPNLSNAEGTDSKFDMLSNGFKIRSATSTINGSGNTIIYMAFAQNPFKYSLAR